MERAMAWHKSYSGNEQKEVLWLRQKSGGKEMKADIMELVLGKWALKLCSTTIP
jgi:hypothetical protein